MIVAGCGSMPVANHVDTNVNLAHNNYVVKQIHVTGESKGFCFLPFMTTMLYYGCGIPVRGVSFEEAYEDLYRNAGIQPGDSFALINVAEDIGGKNFFIVGWPELVIRADVIEFTD